MSDQTEQTSLPLPGVAGPAGDGGELEAAVRRTIAEHQLRANLGEVDAGKCAIALELCRVAVRKRASGRMSTVANDLRLLSELLDSMKPETTSEADERLRKAMDEWSAAVAHEAGEVPTHE